jgi:diguanylate cyclase (GGDEF)-like protein/PAS domain S-box-containing protein
VAGERAPDEESRIALRTLASQVALAFHRAELSEEVHRRTSEARFASLVQNSTDLITVLDADLNVVYQSPSVQRVLGFTAEELTGAPFARLLHGSENGRTLSQVIASASRCEPQLIECSLQDSEGSPHDFEILCTNMLEQGAVGGIVLNGRDVSERKAFEHQLEAHAFRDPVTHLANRALFNERVRHGVARARREQISLAVVFLDLDDFKTVNDSLGHAAGDHLLREVAERISTVTRAADTAARFGGDEFAILLEDCELQAAVDTAERIVAALLRPISLDAQDVVVRASIGISIAPSGAPSDAEELVRNADAAMYIAKAEGKGGYRIFEPAMHERVLARLELRADLERALERQEFELHYQPVVRLVDQAVTGIEALLRWRHPVRGLVAPDQFIPFAEETGLIVPIGRWVLHEGCLEARRLRDSIAGDALPGVSINLSVKQLFHPDVCSDVRAALEGAGLPANALTLEITETVMMTDTELAVQRLSDLRELGVKLAMDDFGTGYSSLSYLSRFPLDILKMDRSLLAAGGSPITSGLASAVLGLGQTFDLEVVAEGIEYPEQSETLGQLGCELGQGFYFAKPMAPPQLFEYFEGLAARAQAS